MRAVFGYLGDPTISRVNLGISYLSPEKQFGIMGNDGKVTLSDDIDIVNPEPSSGKSHSPSLPSPMHQRNEG